MRKDTINKRIWLEKFNNIHESVTKMRSIIGLLIRRPEECSNKLAILEQELSAVDQNIGNLKWYFGMNSSDKWLKGQMMTKEEFYLLAAQGILTVPSETGEREAYEEYNYYLYEDDEQTGYINPSAEPDSPPVQTPDGGRTQKVSLKIGICPENVKISFLKEEQKDFFKRYKPGLFSRFKKD